MLAPTTPAVIDTPTNINTIIAANGLTYTVRKFTWGDLPAIVDLINTSNEIDKLEDRAVLEDVELEWRTPGFSAEDTINVVLSPDGQIIAYSYIEISHERYKGFGEGIIHPAHRDQGIGTNRMRHDETTFYNAVKDEFDAEQPIYTLRWAMDKETAAIALYEAEGYQHVRTFYQMRVNLDTPLQPATLPAGYELRPFDKERDAYAVYQAQQEAFSEHWGHTSDSPYEEWAHYRFNNSYYNPDMLLIAWHGDEIAGSSLCRAYGPDVPELAWVGTLSVRRPHRKAGLGSALLQQSFYTFQQMGYTLGGLGVDAENRSNALAMYERAGMFVHKRFLSYRKILRGNPELIKD